LKPFLREQWHVREERIEDSSKGLAVREFGGFDITMQAELNAAKG
jgi:hypothetical protein